MYSRKAWYVRPDALEVSPARAIELCDQLRHVATELRNVLLKLGDTPAGLVLRAPEPVPVGKGLSRIEAARKCGVSLSTFDSAIRPFIPDVRIGARRVFLESDLDTWLTRENGPATAAGTVNRARRGRRRAADTVLDPKALAVLSRLKVGGKARV